MAENKDISFVARHYRKGRFDVEAALRRVHPRPTGRSRLAKIAAAAAIAIFVSATAAVLIHKDFFAGHAPSTEQTSPAPSAPGASVRAVIDFEATPLPDVVAEIQRVYGVEITDVPADAESYTLSLHYEGTAADLVEIINEILATDMKISH